MSAIDPTARATLGEHERVAVNAGKRMQAVTTAARGRQRQGLNGGDIDRIVRMIKDEHSWPKIKAALFDVADATLEGWKDELYRRAVAEPTRILPDGPGQAGHRDTRMAQVPVDEVEPVFATPDEGDDAQGKRRRKSRA